MKKWLTVVLLILFFQSYGQVKSLPHWFLNSFTKINSSNKYEIKSYLNPVFFDTDFTGDGIDDIVVSVIEKVTRKKGILVINHNGDFYVFGAGIKFGNGGDDFKWVSGWKLYKSKIAYQTKVNKDGDLIGSQKIMLLRPALYIYNLEDGQPNSGAIIYWNGKKYIWIQQGE